MNYSLPLQISASATASSAGSFGAVAHRSNAVRLRMSRSLSSFGSRTPWIELIRLFNLLASVVNLRSIRRLWRRSLPLRRYWKCLRAESICSLISWLTAQCDDIFQVWTVVRQNKTLKKHRILVFQLHILSLFLVFLGCLHSRNSN